MHALHRLIKVERIKWVLTNDVDDKEDEDEDGSVEDSLNRGTASRHVPMSTSDSEKEVEASSAPGSSSSDMELSGRSSSKTPV